MVKRAVKITALLMQQKKFFPPEKIKVQKKAKNTPFFGALIFFTYFFGARHFYSAKL